MWVEKLPSGKYRFCERYTDYLTGKNKKVSITKEKNNAQTRKLAQQELNERIDKALAKKEEKNYTFGQVVDAYLEYQKRAIRPSSYRVAVGRTKSLERIIGSDVLINRLTAKTISDGILSNDSSTTAVNNRIKAMRTLLKWAFANNYLERYDIVMKLKTIKATKVNDVKDKYLEGKEVTELLSVMKKPVWRIITKTMVLSGMRIGELIALEVDDVDFKEQVIHITKSYDYPNRTLTPPKTTKSFRDISMQKELYNCMIEAKNIMLEYKMEHGIQDCKLFFCGKDGDYIRYVSYNEYLNQKSKAILHRSISSHALRHTHASLMFEHGIDMETIQRRLGHEKSDITRSIYVHITNELRKADANKISAIEII